jgi:hypothetical protein
MQSNQAFAVDPSRSFKRCAVSPRSGRTPGHVLHELFDCGDSVVAAVSWYTRSRGSESELVQEEAHTWGLRKGRITRFEWGKDLAAALEAPGCGD